MRTGLRTEIILSISLLLAAALLFAGFLLLKLTERNLLEQKRAHALQVVRLIAAGTQTPPEGRYRGAPPFSSTYLNRLQILLGQQTNIDAWRIIDPRLQEISRTSYRGDHEFSDVSPSEIARDEVFESLQYESFSLLRGEESHNFLDLSIPLWADDNLLGLMQVRFSLDDLLLRSKQAQKVIVIYVLVYGVILALFGVYLLNRNVVRPVRQLHQATTTVASGSLTPVNVKSGPGEIHELADSFNQMVEALATSRSETEEYIRALEESNKALSQARSDLVRSEKLATVGHLSAGMAHEIGNPLGAVIGYLNILKDDVSGDPRELVERSLAETSRIDQLVRELLDFAAPVESQAESFCPLTLLLDTVKLVQNQGQFDGITIIEEFAIETCLVAMDRSRLMQVWINLLLNARDAMNGEGVLTLSARMERENIVIDMTDDGEGIHEQDLPRVFEPFFTSKAPGKGYGLGLAVSQRIIDEHGGTIDVSSKAGQGTCFTIALPCDDNFNSESNADE